jgi:ATP-dependent exoDNAse (exonuclease V) beta subunit
MSLSAPPLSDENQRELIRTALESTLIVEAAAGTGKTTALVGRMVAMLGSGRADLDRIVAVTFTEAAAGELKLRLRAEIEKARLDELRPAQERERLKAGLPKLEEARVGTIHGFCSDLLREHPVAAGVDPQFEVAAGETAAMLFEGAFERWFEQQLASPGPAVQRILCRRTRDAFGTGAGDEGPRALLRQAALSLVEQRDFPAPWRVSAGFDRDRVIDALVGELIALADWAPRCNRWDKFGQSLGEIAHTVEQIRRAERARPRDYDWLEALLGELPRGDHWQSRGTRPSNDPAFPAKELRERRERVHAGLTRFVQEAGADLAPRLRDELWPVVQAYEAAKERTGCLDFNDLLIHARDLVRDDAAVRREIQARFTHYFVDEFQDADPLQVEILMLLAADDAAATDWRDVRTVPGKLFLVGDPKQSIYRFRRADVELYRDVQRRLLAQGALAVHLSVSFRSAPEIQHAVNAAFRPRFEADAGGYVPLAHARRSHEAQPAVVALPVPAPYGTRRLANASIQRSLPDVIAAWIEWLVRESGWTVTERERPEERVRVEPRHICLLFKHMRSFGDDATRPYVNALEARQLQHLLVGGNTFHGREEIEILRTALAAIERPDDELAVFATLRGPLVAVSDAELIVWRERFGSLHPFRPIPAELPESLTGIAAGLELLKSLHRGRNRRPVADTIAQLLEATRAHAAFAIWPTGMQALANIDRLRILARSAEQRGLVSFRGFVEYLEDEAERGNVAEAPLLEEGVQGVRIMSAHKAKGLEFPIVILADMTTKESFGRADRWTDPARGLCVQRLAGCSPPELLDHAAEEIQRDREEAARLLYVAATRARDVLVVPVVGDARRDGWLSTLHPVVYPPPARARARLADRAPGTPAMGTDSVVARPVGEPQPDDSIIPGLHQPEAGAHRIVWWDPARLRLDVQPSNGLAQTRILEADESGRAQQALASWEAWRHARTATVDRGANPSSVVRTATEWARSRAEIPGSDAVSVINARWTGERPGGARFGTLVHALLATVNLDADREHVTAQGGLCARLLGADEEERRAAVEIAAAALTHPLLRRAAGAGAHCRRESAILLRLEDGTLIECVADLAFRDGEDWVVVDFKTDSDLEGRADAYRRQVALYVRGIAEATSRRARGHLLQV